MNGAPSRHRFNDKENEFIKSNENEYALLNLNSEYFSIVQYIKQKEREKINGPIRKVAYMSRPFNSQQPKLCTILLLI